MPFCPVCQREPDTPDSRCPLDHALYLQGSCPHCGAEVLPRERFCASCGRPQPAGPAARVAAPLAAASLPARLAALVLDGLTLYLLVEVLGVPGPATAVAAPLLALAYYGGLQSGGRQTLGQHVMGQVVLTDDRRPLPLRTALLRTLASAAAWLPGVPALAPLWRPDRTTLAEGWTRTRTLSDRRA